MRRRAEIHAQWSADLRAGRCTLAQLRWCLEIARRTPRTLGDNREFIAALEQLEAD